MINPIDEEKERKYYESPKGIEELRKRKERWAKEEQELENTLKINPADFEALIHLYMRKLHFGHH